MEKNSFNTASLFRLDIPPPARVLVAMSGGVDSSVAAAGLKKEGYDVVGVTLLLHETKTQGTACVKSCCSQKDIEDARAVAARLSIPHYVLDRIDVFRRDIIAPFVGAYRKGLTPLPCARCNEKIKFPVLADLARTLGAGRIVSGHYARLEVHKIPSGSHYRLLRGLDPQKDQSYFLYGLPETLLPFVRFPLGAATKTVVRQLAEAFGLSIARKPDSQGICFVPGGDYRPVIRQLAKALPPAGDFVDQAGRKLGRHKGIAFYTVGQRRGLGIGGQADPLYVVAIRPSTDEVVLGPRAALGVRRIFGGTFHRIGAPVLTTEGFEADVQIRYRQEPQKARIRALQSFEGSESLPSAQDRPALEVVFENPVEGFAPGQAIVVYNGPQLVGGAIGCPPAWGDRSWAEGRTC